jgi:RNA polymerase sigma factor (sigma-70 family)
VAPISGDLSLPVEDPQTLVAGLVATHGNQLRRFLLARVRNTADVPDLVQEVYLRMLRVPDVESIRSPEAYLFTVAIHVVHQHTLSQSTTPALVDLTRIPEMRLAPLEADPALETHALWCLEQLQVALEELPPKARATFLLHRRDGLSLEEIGTRLGISLGMVKKYLMKALIHLRRRLERAE